MALGRCQCGAFEYSVEGSLGDVRYCHCAKCRRGNGTAFTANARIHRSQWSIEGPRDLITEYEHKPGLFKAFCARCGSPLYARSSQDPDDIRVRIGGLEGPLFHIQNVLSLGGTFGIKSAFGQGTTVSAWVPLKVASS